MAAENGTHEGIEVSLQELNDINTEINVIVDQLVDEEAALHAKYELKKASLYKKREGVIANIPKFWLTCQLLGHCPTSLIEMEDAEAISYLQRIAIDRSTENPINYKIEFEFAENPYFSNKILVKEFDFSKKDHAKVINQKIDWKEGKDLTAPAKKEQGSEESDEFSENEDASFFCWFNDGNGSELADLIANDLFPNAGMYFAGTENSDDEDDTPIFDFGHSDNEDGINGEADDAESEEDAEDAPANKRAKRD
ncbi:hypothetical protein LPJ74_001541 [Coemansia sp. RSA 1843]|nr:hypothetical protein LPJ74_001541 [Coemansia sp. RSA 1843]